MNYLTSTTIEAKLMAIERCVREIRKEISAESMVAPDTPLPKRESNNSRPYTPETLAERWECSAQHVRDVIRAGDLPAFRIGRLIRIAARDVIEHERAAGLGANAPDSVEPTDDRRVPFVVKKLRP